MQKRELVENYSISPVTKGGWQLSTGHSLGESVENKAAVDDTISFIEAGITTLDFGDIYTGVEEIIGQAVVQLIQRYGESGRSKVQLHTKYVPNEDSLVNFDKADIERTVDRSLRRLNVDQVDLVQFHWWRYEHQRYLEAMQELFRLKSVGKIRHVGITNFDLKRLQEMVESGFKPASIQLQYSVLDRRPEEGLSQYCIENGIGILAYGTVAGGFISEKYLGAADPSEFETRSNVKYRLIIEEFGGWELFQELLAVLNLIAIAHKSDIATISSAFTLSRRGVKGVIVGARNLDHLQSNLSIPEIVLSTGELATIDEILNRAKGPRGPVYDLERYSDRHRNIMKTNLN
jgi:aryl-alcohol dehydrogenase-like predicted oxidoreductase